MSKSVIYTDRVMRPIAHFSHAARVGNVIHIGATAGTDEQRRLGGSTPGMTDIGVQTRRMFHNVGIVLGLLGAGLEHTVRVKTYITDLRDQQQYRELYAETFGAISPDHIVVGSHGFPLPHAAIELDLVAVVDSPIVRVPAGGVIAAGRFYCAAGPAVGGDDFAGQASSAFEQLRMRIALGGLKPSEIVYLHATLGDCRDVPAFAGALAEAFPSDPPACTLVIAPLAGPNAMLQIEAIAAQGGGRRLEGTRRAKKFGLGAAAVLAGEDLYIGGQVGEVAGGRLAAGTEAQTKIAWERIRALLAAAEMNELAIVRTNNVLTDWRHYADFNAGYGAHVSEPYPPRATVLGGLARRNALVQVEGIAHRRGDDAVIVQVPS